MKISNRRKARFFAVQALYQWQLNPQPANVISLQFAEKFNPKKVDIEYFNELLNGVIACHETLDQTLLPYLDRKIVAVDVVELVVLRLAAYELMYRLEIPFKVVIDEALELVKLFGSVDGFKYVNLVLDRMVQRKVNERQVEE